MSNSVNNLSAAVKNLGQYFSMLGRSDVISMMIEGTQGSEDALMSLSSADLGGGDSSPTGDLDVQVIKDLMYILMDNTEGAFFTKDILNTKYLRSKFDVNTSVDAGGNQYDGIDKYVRVVYTPGHVSGESSAVYNEDSGWTHTAPGELQSAGLLSSYDINEITRPGSYSTDGDGMWRPTQSLLDSKVNVAANPDRTGADGSPSLSAFVFPNLRVGPPTRNTDAVALFCNSIPTLEMSRCVPHIDIKFVSEVPPIVGERTKQLSILRFLGMDQEGMDNIGLSDALPTNIQGYLLSDPSALTTATSETGTTYGTSVSSAGMELFTSPQMMVNANMNKPGEDFGGLAGRVRDPMVPLATLDQLKVDVAGVGQHLLANKTGTLSFTLHDRSRMADIAPLISMDLFSSTFIIVEYGWIHPQGSDADSNVFGALLNSMRSTAAFNIVATNFNVQNDGQVKITIKLASRGSQDIRTIPIGIGNVMPLAPLKGMIIPYLAKRLAAEKSRAKDHQSRDILQKVPVSMSTVARNSTVVPRSVYDRFIALLKHTDTEPGVAELEEEIKLLVGEDGISGLESESHESLAHEVRAKLTGLRNPATPDPFKMENHPLCIQKAIKAGVVTDNFTSLGNIFLSFVGYPLACSGKFDEVQMMFYRFNNNSAEARTLPTIASFEVYHDELFLLLDKYIKSNPAMSVQGFIGFINKNFTNNPSDYNFGFDLAGKYRQLTAAQGADAETTDDKKEKQNAVKAIQDEIDEFLRTTYGASGGGQPRFDLPDVRVYFETLPAMTVEETNPTYPSVYADPSKVILRVHVFDAAATPHTHELFLLSAMSDGDIAISLKNASSSANSEAASSSTSESDVPAAPAPTGAEGGESTNTDVASPAATTSTAEWDVITTNLSSTDIKKMIKSSVPSFTFGSQFSAITNLSLSSTTSGPASDVFILNARGHSNDPQVAEGAQQPFEDVQVIPASVNIEMFGCPLLEYGQQFFVDVGTGTTADNMYTVNKITHTISAGRFTTNIGMAFCSNGTMNSFRSILAASLSKLGEIKNESDAS